MKPIERLGVGLAVMGIGVPLFVGLPPPWWLDMPPILVHAGIGLGIILDLVGAGLVLNSIWVGKKMFPLIGMAACGIGFVLCATWYFWPSQSFDDHSVQESSAAVAQLAAMGWSVKHISNNLLQFEVTDSDPPSLERSAPLFAKLTDPFRISFQRVNQINGLRLLTSAKALTGVELAACKVTDLSELGSLTQISYLTISQVPFERTDILDLSSLSSLTNLTELYLNSSRIRDLNFIANLQHLTKLNLWDSFASDLTPVGNHPTLTEIYITGSHIDDLSPLRTDIGLVRLDISLKQSRSLPTLRELPNLKQINVYGGSGDFNLDYDAIGQMKNIDSLSLSTVQSVDFAPMSNLINLRSLSVNGLGFGYMSHVANSQVLATFVDLESLSLTNLALQNVDFISSMRSLKHVTLNFTPLSVLPQLPQSVETISLFSVNIVDISQLLNLPKLSKVTVGRAPVRSDVLSELKRRGVTVVGD